MATAPPRAAERPGGFRRIWRALRQLFHEMIGAVFAILALSWMNMAVRAYLRDVARWLILMAAGVAALMVVFSWTSFRRAWRIR